MMRPKWKLVLVHFEMLLILTQDTCMVYTKHIVLILMHDRCRFAPNIPQAPKLFYMHPMVLLGDEAQVKPRFDLFEDSAKLDARLVHGLHQTP
jgi:hypothetical protein